MVRSLGTAALLCICTHTARSAHGGDRPEDASASLIVVSTPGGRSLFQAMAEDCASAGGPARTGGALALPGSLRPLLRTAPAHAALAADLGLDRTFVLSGLTTSSAPAVAAWLERSGWCEEVAFDRTARLHNADDALLPPNDPLFAQQYALHNHGQSVGGQQGLPGADIGALRAWEVTQGSEAVTVAIFDAGVSHSHPDLAPKLVPGWNFMTDSADTDDSQTSHGTHCAGIIGAVTANRQGIAGLGWFVRLMPVVVVNRYGFGNESTLAEALVWAADQGVSVASVSLGFDPADGDSSDRTLHAAVVYATEVGMLVCASSGNVANQGVAAPARYPESLAVGASDNRDQPWSGMSTGPELGVVAPGVSVVSTWDSDYGNPGQDTYAVQTGTSQACPHVAGLAALIRSINPQISPTGTKAIIEMSAADLGPAGWDPGYGHGRIDAGAAAALALQGAGSHGIDFGCWADFDRDGVVDTRDFLAYLTAYRDRDRRADLASPFGTIDTRDLLTFLELWSHACE